MAKSILVGAYDARLCTPGAAAAYAEELARHIELVTEFGHRLGVDPMRLAMHDLSKYDEEEFGPYAMFFHGGPPTPTVKAAFALACMHHYHHNDHHPEYWYLLGPTLNDLIGAAQGTTDVSALPLGIQPALEMLADWLAVSVQKTGSEDLHGWLCEKAPRIRLHYTTASFVLKKLAELGQKTEGIHFYGYRKD